MSELTLTIYPKQPSRPGPGKGWADWRRDQDRECKMAHDKRFSDAELAAEVWQAEMQWQGYSDDYCWGDEHRDHRDQLGRDADTMHRFAVTPHYYEEAE